MTAWNEHLAVDAKAALGGFEHLNEQAPQRIRRQVQGVKHDVSNAPDHFALLLGRKDAAGHEDFDNRSAIRGIRHGLRRAG